MLYAHNGQANRKMKSPSEKGVSGYLHNQNLLIFTHTKHVLNTVSILQKIDIKRH